LERRDVEEVLDGDLDDFIYAFLKQNARTSGNGKKDG